MSTISSSDSSFFNLHLPLSSHRHSFSTSSFLPFLFHLLSFSPLPFTSSYYSFYPFTLSFPSLPPPYFLFPLLSPSFPTSRFLPLFFLYLLFLPPTSLPPSYLSFPLPPPPLTVLHSTLPPFTFSTSTSLYPLFLLFFPLFSILLPYFFFPSLLLSPKPPFSPSAPCPLPPPVSSFSHFPSIVTPSLLPPFFLFFSTSSSLFLCSSLPLTVVSCPVTSSFPPLASSFLLPSLVISPLVCQISPVSSLLYPSCR